MKIIYHLLFFSLVLLEYDCLYSKNNEKTEDLSNNTELHVRFDKRVETVYFVLMLSEKYNMLISRHPTTYKIAAMKYFSKYNSHPAVQLAKEIIPRGFSFDYAANWIFQFSDFPGFNKTSDAAYAFSGRKMNADTLEFFRQELSNFYIQANCDSFFRTQNEFIHKMISETKNGFSKINLPGIIESYFGIRKNAAFQVVLSPLLHNGGYGIDFDNRTNNKKELIALIGPSGEKDSAALFDKEFLEHDLIIHEFSHSYANGVVDEFYSQLKKYEEALFPLAQGKLENDGVAKESFLYELMVRAITIRIVKNIYGKEAADKLLDYEKSVGFTYIANITDALNNYERERDKYPSLREFMPEIIKQLEKIKI